MVTIDGHAIYIASYFVSKTTIKFPLMFGCCKELVPTLVLTVAYTV